LGESLACPSIIAETAMKIRAFEARDMAGVVRLSLRAWAPVGQRR